MTPKPVFDRAPEPIAASNPAGGLRIDPEWYRAIVETAPDATVMVDADGVIMLINHQTEVLFGYIRDELIGERVETLVPERFRDHHHIHRDGYFGEPKTREMGADIELLGLRKDGSEFPVEISLAPLRTQTGVYAIASVRDATARKKSRDQINSLLETAPDAMVIIDADGLINRVNAQTERMFGYVREALIGKRVEILIPEHRRESHVGHRSGYFRDPKVRGMGTGLELSGRRKDGSEFPIEISLSPLTTDEGVFATAAVRDVTERIEFQNKLREYTARLEASNEELEQFAYIASHDLQSPLRSIVSFTQLLRRALPSPDAKIEQYLEFIEDGGRRMHTLVKDILTLSRVQRGGTAFVPVDLHDLAETIVAEAAPDSGRVHLDTLPTLNGDEAQLGQVLQNLISNALKFHAANVMPEVWVSCEASTDTWTVAVEDSGIGIDPQQREKVFEIFARLHTQEEYAGTGIGLAICKRIVHRHGGEIRIVDSRHGGCRFEFTLPRNPASNNTTE